MDDSPKSPTEKTDLSLSNIFGTEPMSVTVIDENGVSIPMDEEDDKKIDADADKVRQNIYNILDKGDDALKYAIDLAKESDSPRAFEVVGTLLKNLADINMQILGSHEAKNKAKGRKPVQVEQGPSKVVNQSIVFTGSTAELSKIVSDMRKESE